MYYARTHLSILFAIVLVAAMTGCSDNDKPTNSSGANTVAIAAVYPADGSVGVATSAPISLTFSGPVDTLSVIRNLWLAGGQPMHDWEDSLMHNGGFGMMNIGMQDHMTNWIDSIATPGTFHWNAALNSCEFVPDATLMPETDYLCLIYEDGMHDHHGGMMGGSGSSDVSYQLVHFHTGQ